MSSGKALFQQVPEFDSILQRIGQRVSVAFKTIDALREITASNFYRQRMTPEKVDDLLSGAFFCAIRRLTMRTKKSQRFPGRQNAEVERVTKGAVFFAAGGNQY